VLANNQTDTVEEYGYKRFVLIEAFQRLLDNDIPTGTTGLDTDAVKDFTGDLYVVDADISYSRAKVIGGIIAALNDSQKSELTALHTAFYTLFNNTAAGGSIDSSSWPEATEMDISGLTNRDDKVLVGTYASQLFSWYIGSVYADTYFCPERHGTCFGSFYLKDIPPVMSTSAVNIDTELTANMGAALIDLLGDQSTLITSIADLQRSALATIVEVREDIATKFRLFIDNGTPTYDDVVAMVQEYGEAEGEMIYYYATQFVAVENILTEAQRANITAMRTEYYERFPEYQANSSAYDCSGAWLYAKRVALPEIPDTDFLFGTSATTTTLATTTTTLAATTTTTQATTTPTGCTMTTQDDMTIKGGTPYGP
ncbi:MAG: hypothetical protein GY696_08205, partial [Gammaproteobacteria bacterium]|nr:hypothetical protein [Gammaproteobacteria bacterium]